MIPRRFSELGRREQRWALLRSTAVVAGGWVVLVALYYLLPDRRGSAADTGFRLAVGLLLVAAFVGWQTTHIGRSKLPELRALEALGTAVPLFLVIFSGIYLTAAHNSPSNFSQHLDHTSALYFTRPPSLRSASVTSRREQIRLGWLSVSRCCSTW